MALGTNYKRNSRKYDILMILKIDRVNKGMSVSEAVESVEPLNRKTVAELEALLIKERPPK